MGLIFTQNRKFVRQIYSEIRKKYRKSELTTADTELVQTFERWIFDINIHRVEDLVIVVPETVNETVNETDETGENRTKPTKPSNKFTKNREKSRKNNA